MKMYKFKGDTGIREELDIPAEEMERATELNRILTEAAAENDEALMELYFEKGVLTQDELRSGLKLGLAGTRPDSGILRVGQTRYRCEAADGIHHQRSSRTAQSAQFRYGGRPRNRAR